MTVTGVVDPAILIKKLNKAGKQAELWPAKGGKNQNLINQLQKLQPQHAKGQHKGNEKPQKGGGGTKDEKKGHHSPQQAKGFLDLKFPSLKNFKIPFKKETKKVKSDHSRKEEVDEGSDFGDEFDEYDEFDDEEIDDMDGSDAESYDEHPKMVKAVHFQPNGGTEGAKDKKAGGGGGGGAQLQNKSGGGKKGGGGNKDGGKNGHGVHDSKSGGGSNNSKSGTHAHNGNPSNKGGGGNLSVGGGGLPMGQPHMMGQLGNMQGLMGSGPPPQGLPTAGGYSHGGSLPHDMLPAGANPYQQQYLQALMQQQQQQRMMMNGQFPPMSYGYGQPAYMPQPQPYTMFSDENPDSCSVM